MSVLLMMKDKLQIEIAGYEAEARRVMASGRRVIEIKAKKNGRIILIHGRDVTAAEVIGEPEEKMLEAMAAAKAAAEAKKNPNPGREPQRTIPGGGRVNA